MVSSSFILLIGSFGFGATSFLGIIATLGSFLGIFASIHVFKDSDVGGFLFIVSAILVLLGSTFFGVLGALLLLVAGISALENKNFLNKAFVNKQLIFKRFYFSQFAGEVYGLI